MAVLLNVLLSQLDPTGGLWSNIRPSQPPSSTLSWGASFRRLNPFNATKSIPDGDLHEDVYAIKELVKLAAVKLLDLCTETKYTFKCLYNISKDFFKDRLSFQMALLVLMSECHISISKIDELQVIEILATGPTDGSSSSSKSTTASELEILRLKERIEELENSMSKVESQMKRLRDDAKAKLKAGDERQARRILRQKNRLSETLAQQEREENNLRKMLTTILKTQATGRELDAYQDTVELYASVKDFTVEEVQETSKEMAEACNESIKAEEALSSGCMGEEDSLDRELKELLDDEAMEVDDNSAPTDPTQDDSAPTDPTQDDSAPTDPTQETPYDVDEDLMDG